MKIPQMIKLTCVVILFSFVCGCTLLSKSPIDKNYYDLVVKPPIKSDQYMFQGAGILVKEFHIASAFDSHSFILRVKNDEYINDYYSEFISYPAKLITERFTEHLCANRYFSSVYSATKKNIEYRLSGKIMRLYGDFQIAASPKAIMELRLILEKKSNNTFAVVISKTYGVETPVESQKPTDLVAGWSDGLSTIIRQFLTDFNQTSE